MHGSMNIKKKDEIIVTNGKEVGVVGIWTEAVLISFNNYTNFILETLRYVYTTMNIIQVSHHCCYNLYFPNTRLKRRLAGNIDLR
jgi:hypothetical protein